MIFIGCPMACGDVFRGIEGRETVNSAVETPGCNEAQARLRLSHGRRGGKSIRCFPTILLGLYIYCVALHMPLWHYRARLFDLFMRFPMQRVAPEPLRARDANAGETQVHQPSTYFVYGCCKKKSSCGEQHTNNQWWGAVPVTNIGMPTLAATSMVPDTVVPPFSFCIIIQDDAISQMGI